VAKWGLRLNRNKVENPKEFQAKAQKKWEDMIEEYERESLNELSDSRRRNNDTRKR